MECEDTSISMWPLGKYLTKKCGYPSSRDVRSFLTSHRITVNGIVETSYSRKVNDDFLICVDGIPAGKSPDSPLEGVERSIRDKPYIIAYYKPCGIVCSLKDDIGRKDLHDIIPPEYYRCGLHPVGRLDQHSCGLLLFTNDGRLTRLLLDPSSAIPRRYECVVTGFVEFESLSSKLQNGVENRFCEPYVARLLESRPLSSNETFDHQTCDDGNRRYDGPQESADQWMTRTTPSSYSIVVVEVCEGKQRMVRRMLAHCDHHVVNLRRLSYGEIALGELAPGQFKECDQDEVLWAMSLMVNR